MVPVCCDSNGRGLCLLVSFNQKQTNKGGDNNMNITEVEYGASHIEALMLFRVDLNKLELCSIGVHHVWLPNVIEESKCHMASKHGHLKPEVDCTCGIWACKGRAGIRRTFPLGPLLKPDHRALWWFDNEYPKLADINKIPLQVSARVKLWEL